MYTQYMYSILSMNEWRPRAVLDNSILSFIIFEYNKEMINAYVTMNDDMEHGIQIYESRSGDIIDDSILHNNNNNNNNLLLLTTATTTNATAAAAITNATDTTATKSATAISPTIQSSRLEQTMNNTYIYNNEELSQKALLLLPQLLRMLQTITTKSATAISPNIQPT